MGVCDDPRCINRNTRRVNTTDFRRSACPREGVQSGEHGNGGGMTIKELVMSQTIKIKFTARTPDGSSMSKQCVKGECMRRAPALAGTGLPSPRRFL